MTSIKAIKLMTMALLLCAFIMPQNSFAQRKKKRKNFSNGGYKGLIEYTLIKKGIMLRIFITLLFQKMNIKSLKLTGKKLKV